MTRLARLVAAAVIAATLTLAPPADAAPKAFEGKDVVVLVRGGSNDDNLYIWGRCTEADDHGLWLDQTHIQYMPNGVQKKKARVYVPFVSVSYVKFDQG